MLTIGSITKLIVLFFFLDLAASHNPRPLPPLVKDCEEANPITAGVYRIQTEPQAEPSPVLCVRRKLDNTVWMVIQQRFDGSVNFNRSWQAYRNGFGNITGRGEFWLGLEKIYAITATGGYQLAVELTDFNGAYRYGQYSSFALGNELSRYELQNLGQFSGNVDCMTAHLNKPFSTYDSDGDSLDQLNCAVRHQGAWWYNNCYLGGSNLNGRYLNAVSDLAITCIPLGNPPFKGLKQTRLLIRKPQPLK